MTTTTGFKPPPFYGWTTLIGVMAAYAGLCGDITYAYGLFLPAMSETFHWSRSALSGPYVLFFIIGGLLGPAAGMAIARFGPRKNIISFNLIAAFGLLGLSQVNTIWHVYLFFGIMAGLGIAFGEFIPITTVINNWFIRRRSMAMGLFLASGGVGGFVFPPLISKLITGFGWRWAWVYLAGQHLLLTVILGGILIRNRPEDLGQHPDGTPETLEQNLKDQPVHRRPVYQTPVDWTVGEAMRTPALWLIMALFSILLFATNMLTTHQVAYLQDLNFSPLLSASALGLMLGMSVIGRLACGFLGMKFEGRHLAIFFLTGMVLGIMALIQARGVFFIYLYSVLTGIGFGGMIVLMPNLLGAYFGRRHYSRIVGWTAPVVTLISAGSPTLAGFLFDATGSYFLPFSIAVGFVSLGIVLTILLRPPRFPVISR
ncbi:MAG: MFS transporter [Deltaproteobacteria bacterium]|nr:MFS transporter [Deltaproteobacteria bacterium]